jgi:hypothetical protein
MNESKEPIYDKNGEEIVNPYYYKVSKRFRIAKNLVLVVLVLYVCVMFWAFRDRITSENLQYLLRNINMDITASGNTGDRIHYMISDGATVCEYKDSLVVLDKTQLSFYDTFGNTTFTTDIKMDLPAMAVSDGYAMVYDISGQEFRLYNAFSLIKSGEVSGSIVGAGTSPAGAFVLSIAKPGVSSEFLIYNNSLKLAASVKKKGYSACSALSRDGKNAMLVTYDYSDSGKYLCTVDFIRCSDGKLLSSVTHEGSMPLKAWYTKDGIPMLYTYDGILCFDENGKLVTNVAIDAEKIIKFAFSDSGFAMVYADGYDRRHSRVEWYDSKGKLSGTVEIDGVVTVIKHCLDSFVICADEKIFVINSDKMAKSTYGGHIVDVVEAGDGFYVCGYSKADLVKISDLSFEKLEK